MRQKNEGQKETEWVTLDIGGDLFLLGSGLL